MMWRRYFWGLSAQRHLASDEPESRCMYCVTSQVGLDAAVTAIEGVLSAVWLETKVLNDAEEILEP